MPSFSRMISRFVLACLAAGLAGCGGSSSSPAKEIVELPVRGVQKGVEGITKGAKGIDDASGNIVSSILTDRNRAALVQEHKDTLEHLRKVEKFIEDRGIVTDKREDKLLQDANDRLASVGRQLDAPRIPSDVGLRIYRQLEDVRQSFELLRQQHNTPRYTGFIADR